MTEAEYRVLSKQQDSLIKYIRKNFPTVSYVAFAPKEECGYCIPRGVLVDCTLEILWKLQDHAKRYYPQMLVLFMTETVSEYAYEQLKLVRQLQMHPNYYIN